MKIIGEKLRMARRISNKTITKLSSEIGLTKQAISQFENETAEPSGESLMKIIRALNFPLQFYTTPFQNQMTVKHTFFRALASASELERSTFIDRASLITHIYEYLDEHLYLPELDLPRLTHTDILNREEIEDLADEVRKYWGLGEKPIWNVVGLLEEKGIIVSTLSDALLKIDGFTQVFKSKGNIKYCIVLEKEKRSMARRNFSAAHELGHVLLHTDLISEEIEVDIIKHKEMEKQANNFAACFLLPKEKFIKDLYAPTEYNCYVDLKQKWHVSMTAMFLRARDLQIITEAEYITLIKKYNYRMARSNQNGEKLEPYDDIITVENPELFKAALEFLFENTKIDLYQFKDDLSDRGVAVGEELMTSILSLDEKFFAKYHKEKMPIEFKVKNFILS